MNTSQFAAQRMLALLLLAFSVFLVVSFTSEVKWFANLPFFNQPGMWALIAVIGMTSTSLLMVWNIWKERIHSFYLHEIWFWLRAAEFAVWFMLYVYLVPMLGYLLSSMLFTSLLTVRLGLQAKKWLLSAILLAVATVVVFRSLLKVNVPSGAIYELLPAPFSTFMLTYL